MVRARHGTLSLFAAACCLLSSTAWLPARDVQLRSTSRRAFPRANPGGEAEQLRLAKYEEGKDNSPFALLNPKDGDNPDEAPLKEKVQGFGGLGIYILGITIPGLAFVAVLLGIWTPGTDIDLGNTGVNRSLGSISRYDEIMDIKRAELKKKKETPVEY
eukprot:TRINITY_DN112147_c0_g1_i1.p1 TRINITY_DN112147_c0_g1~~TRINITY_DN112147_c0_g1_i1.p1  ORF type:complete len:159 (-),score=46.26 TRINITY_DN112147_c0_g1_i1:28-504(-)